MRLTVQMMFVRQAAVDGFLCTLCVSFLNELNELTFILISSTHQNL